jgi:small GTP-binding protein
MIQKKICLYGSFAVGKTSLAARFVRSIFSDRYLTTVGVKIDKKVVRAGDRDVNLVIWDLHGEDDFQSVRMSYFRGASGYLLVADGTRRVTVEHAVILQRGAEEAVGKLPFVFLLNKSDLTEEWEVGEDSIAELAGKGWTVLQCSARTGRGVEEAFRLLTGKMLETP